MRVAVLGAGGVGGYFGGRLAESGVEVVFVARGAHLAAMREGGLRITSPLGDVRLDVTASDRAEDLGVVDAVVVAVKTWQLPAALDGIGPLLGPETFVVPLLNGVEAAAEIATRVGEERVVGGTCKIFSHVAEPAHIAHVGATPWVALGEPAGGVSPRVERLRSLLEEAGVSADAVDDIERVLWEKLLFVGSVGAVGALSRQPIGVLREVAATRAMLRAAMEEVRAVGVARGVALAEAAAEDALTFVDTLPAEGTSSLQRDLAAGRRSELDAWSGAVVRLGEEASVATPVHGIAYAALLPQELEARRIAGAP